MKLDIDQCNSLIMICSIIISLLFTITKCWEFNKDKHIMFVDFYKAYDSIIRKTVWEILQKCGVLSKLIQFFKARCVDTRNKVRI